MSEEQGIPVLSIGIVLGDWNSTNKAWDQAITTLMKQVIAAREGVDSPLRVNVVYHVDGKVAPNEFEGVRTGRFSKKDSHLLVQVAVPPGPVDDCRVVLMKLLDEAVAEAERFARKRRIAEQLVDIRGVIGKLPVD